MNVPQHSLEVQNALKPREITGDLYQRSRPAIVSDKKKEPVDKCPTDVMYVRYGRLLGYAYDPRDVCGTCRHDRMAVLGSKMSTSGTRGLGFPVECTSDQTRWWYLRPTFAYGRPNAAAVSTPATPGPRVVKLNMGKCLDPLTSIIHAPRHCKLRLGFLGIIRHTNWGL
jgi:hypothetical protein